MIPSQVVVAAHDQGWQPVTYTVDENGTTFNFQNGTSQVVKWMNANGTEATRDDLNAVLAEVTDFRIVGDLYWNTDYTYLDEITVSQPDSVVAGGT